jgi:hypothetical protein
MTDEGEETYDSDFTTQVVDRMTEIISEETNLAEKCKLLKLSWIFSMEFGIKQPFEQALRHVKYVLEKALNSNRCYDSIIPGTCGRPKTHFYFTCCQHSYPRPTEQKYLKYDLMPGFSYLVHNEKQICFDYLKKELVIPEDCETSLCCKHGKKIDLTMVLRHIMMLPAGMRELVLNELITEETAQNMLASEKTKEKEAETSKDDEDFVQVPSDVPKE